MEASPAVVDESSACLVCGARAFRPRWEILLKCASCGFVTARVDDRLNTREIYEGDYFYGGEYLDYVGDEEFFRKDFQRMLKRIRRRCPSGRMLEIGSAYGFFAHLAARCFDVLGYEVNPEAAQFGRQHFGLDLRTDDFLRTDPAAMGDPFDVAVMWNVIEHLDRPDLFVQKIADCSRPGGLLYLSTGDIGSLVARLRGRQWRLIHPPSHLHYFDRATIRRFLERYGYEVLDIRAWGTARSLHQMLYSIFVLHMGRRKFYDRLTGIVPAHWGITLNTYDIMTVCARRKAGVGRPPAMES